jgi:hypothetical protein
MIKFSCSMISGSDIFYATLVVEDSKQAKEMAAAETKKAGQGSGMSPYWRGKLPVPPDFSASVLKTHSARIELEPNRTV